ncbi:hypothetical protein D8B23_22935, partial [Verminephrobacter aporrectodeae subsp. tuberculatae]|nr:hypothetical protein [Verminephrobacter aporrectodeae subsp. tuberculatae]
MPVDEAPVVGAVSVNCQVMPSVVRRSDNVPGLAAALEADLMCARVKLSRLSASEKVRVTVVDSPVQSLLSSMEMEVGMGRLVS